MIIYYVFVIKRLVLKEFFYFVEQGFSLLSYFNCLLFLLEPFSSRNSFDVANWCELFHEILISILFLV